MSEEKSLQKVTDLEQIVDKESYDEYLKHNDPSNELFAHIHGLLGKAYTDPELNESVFRDILVETYDLLESTKNRADKIRNLTYEINRQKIAISIHNNVLNNGMFPQVTTIQDVTGLSRTTIYRHLKLDDFTPSDKLVKGKFDIMASYALEQLYRIGIEERNHTALKTFIEMVNGSNGIKQVNNYIQINNLKLTKEEFEQLPDEVILQIEDLISGIKVSESQPDKT